MSEHNLPVLLLGCARKLESKSADVSDQNLPILLRANIRDFLKIPSVT